VAEQKSTVPGTERTVRRRVRGEEQGSNKASGSTRSMSGTVIPTLRRSLEYTVVAPGY
jgi:hypothetical protein